MGSQSKVARDGSIRGAIFKVAGERIKPISKVHRRSDRRVLEWCKLEITNNKDRDIPELTCNLQNITKELIVELEDVM